MRIWTYNSDMFEKRNALASSAKNRLSGTKSNAKTAMLLL